MSTVSQLHFMHVISMNPPMEDEILRHLQFHRSLHIFFVYTHRFLYIVVWATWFENVIRFEELDRKFILFHVGHVPRPTTEFFSQPRMSLYIFFYAVILMNAGNPCFCSKNAGKCIFLFSWSKSSKKLKKDGKWKKVVLTDRHLLFQSNSFCSWQRGQRLPHDAPKIR